MSLIRTCTRCKITKFVKGNYLTSKANVCNDCRIKTGTADLSNSERLNIRKLPKVIPGLKQTKSDQELIDEYFASGKTITKVETI